MMSASIGLNAQTVTKNDIILKYTDILTSSGDSLLEINQNTNTGFLLQNRILI